jgi:hypothetical protein
MRVGLIAEEESDAEVLKALTSKAAQNKSIGYDRFLGHGCSKLRAKCASWAHQLLQRGCRFVIVCHDLDKSKETELRRLIEASLGALKSSQRLILIPVHEIEAWLLSDPRAIMLTFREHREPRCPGLPESVVDPKKTLEKIIWSTFHKRYVNTIHNGKIASHMRLSALGKCASFCPHPKFVKEIINEMR